MKKIALVTVNFGGTEDTLELLESVKKLDTQGIDFRFVIADATPDKWIGDYVESPPPYLKLLQIGKNKGFAGNYNVVMKYAVAWGADYVLIINNDTTIGDSQLVKKLSVVLDKNSDAAVVSPKVYFASGYEFFKERYKKENEGQVIWYAGGEFDWNNVLSIHRGIDEIDEGKYDKTEKVGFVSGACLMIRADTLKKVGYFNEDYFAYLEDDEWQQRILTSGKSLYYAGETYIYHKVSRTAGIGSEETDYLHTRNRLYFTFKYASARTKFAVLRQAVGQLLLGRPAQRLGVIDFFRGVKGPSPYKKNQKGKYKYPVRLSVLVSNYKTLDLTKKLLQSTYKPGSGFDRNNDEILVIDDGSGDSFSDLKKEFSDAEFLMNESNKGFVASYNRLFDFSRGKYLLMLNSDIEVTKGSLSSLVTKSKELKDKAVLTGKLVFPDGSPQDSCFKLPTAWGAFKEYFLKIKGSYFMFRPESSKPTRVEGAVMADYFIPRNILSKVGLLNEKLFMYFEDIDYARRLKGLDIPIYFCPDIKFYHHHGASSQKAGGLNRQLIESSKTYHGAFNYFFVTFALWLGQKFGRVSTPH